MEVAVRWWLVGASWEVVCTKQQWWVAGASGIVELPRALPAVASIVVARSSIKKEKRW